jgi:hypothetical protein
MLISYYPDKRYCYAARGATAGYLAPIGSEVSLQIAADFTQFAFAFDDTFCAEAPIGKEPIVL